MLAQLHKLTTRVVIVRQRVPNFRCAPVPVRGRLFRAQFSLCVRHGTMATGQKQQQRQRQPPRTRACMPHININKTIKSDYGARARTRALVGLDRVSVCVCVCASFGFRSTVAVAVAGGVTPGDAAAGGHAHARTHKASGT